MRNGTHKKLTLLLSIIMVVALLFTACGEPIDNDMDLPGDGEEYEDDAGGEVDGEGIEDNANPEDDELD